MTLYTRDTDLICLCCSVADEGSLEEAKEILLEIDGRVEKDNFAPFVLLGLKADLRAKGEHEFSSKEGEEFYFDLCNSVENGRERGKGYRELSAWKDPRGVSDFFKSIARRLMKEKAESYPRREKKIAAKKLEKII